MDRRAFFSSVLRKTSQQVVKHVDKKVKSDAARWIRPPFALDELEFLMSCTRCGACTEACPHGVIFPLSARLGAKVAATPALDLLNRGCHLCEDWPCVASCKDGALELPEAEGARENPSLPRLARVAIDPEACFPYQGPECGACDGSCPAGALLWDQQRPHIDDEKCVGCGLCREACIVSPSAISITSISEQKA